MQHMTYHEVHAHICLQKIFGKDAFHPKIGPGQIRKLYGRTVGCGKYESETKKSDSRTTRSDSKTVRPDSETIPINKGKENNRT